MWKNYKNIVWDWNGTLFDDTWLCKEIVNEFFARQEISPLSLDDYRERFSFPIDKFYIDNGYDFSTHTYKELSTEFHNLYAKRRGECSLHADVIDTLNLVRENGKPQYILSAHPQEMLHQIVQTLEVQQYFTHIAGLGDYMSLCKRDLGVTLIEREELNPSSTLMIGDTAHDVETAEEMGIDCVLVSTGYQSVQKLKACNVPIYSSLSEIFNL